MQDKFDQLQNAIQRIKSIQFGEQVTNVCASIDNPRKYSLFSHYVLQQKRNRFGTINNYHYAKCTDGKGNFWLTDALVVFKGRLPDEECKKLYEEIRAIEDGKDE